MTRRIHTQKPLTGHTLTVCTLYSLFGDLDETREMAQKFPIDKDAKKLIMTLCCGYKKGVDVRFQEVEKVVNEDKRNNKIVVCFSGGKDSTAAAMKMREEGRDVTLFYVKGINTSYPDEFHYVQRIAERLGFPLHVEAVRQTGKSSFKESPVKNQVIASMALDFALKNGCVSICFGDFTEDTVNNSQFYESWSDTQEMWSAWLDLVKTYVPDVELVIPFKNYNETLDIISDNLELANLVHGCILPYRFRKTIRQKNLDTYKVGLLDGRCGSCWKCCTEYIYFADKGVVEFNKGFYVHCLDFLAKKLKSVHPEVKETGRMAAYKAFLHRDFKEYGRKEIV